MADVNLKVNAGIEPSDIKSMQDLLATLKEINAEQKKQQQGGGSSGVGVENQSISEQRRLVAQLSKQLEDLKRKVDDVNKGRKEEIGIIERLNRQITELTKKRNESTSTKEIKAYNSELKKLQSEQQKLINTSGGKGLLNSIINGVGVGVGIGAVSLIAQATNYIKTFTIESFKASANFEQLRIAFSTMLGSNVRANELLNGITKFASETPYAVDQLVDLSKSLLAMGFEADEVLPTLNMLGNVAAGVGKDKMPQLILAMGQIRSAGRLMGNELLQLINAGFDPLRVISEKTGKSMFDLKKEMEKGLISFRDVEDAFKTVTSEGGRFYNLMQAQTLTVAGQIDRLGDAFTQLQIALGNNLQAPVGAVVGLLSELVEMTTDWISLKPSEELEKQRISFNALISELVRNNDNTARRNQLITEINSKYPEYVKNINLEKASNSELLGMLNGVNLALTNKIQLMAREEVLQGKVTEATKAQVKVNEQSRKFTEFLIKNGFDAKRVAQINDLVQSGKDFNAVITDLEKANLGGESGLLTKVFAPGFLTDFEKAESLAYNLIQANKESTKSNEDAQKAQLDLTNEQVKAEDARIKRIETLNAKIKDTNELINDPILKNDKSFVAEQLLELQKLQAELNSLSTDLTVTPQNVVNNNTATTTTSGGGIDKAKKELETLKNNVQKIIEESARLGSQAIENEFERQQQVILTKYTQDVEELTKLRSQMLTSSLPESLKKEGLQAIDASIDYLGQIAYREATDLWQKNEEAKAKILNEGLKVQLQIREQNLDLELLAIEEQRLKEVKVLEDAGLDAEIANEAALKRISEVRLKYGLQDIEQAERLAKESVALIKTAGLDEETATKINNDAIYRIEQQANRQRLDLLLKNAKLTEKITDEQIKRYQDYVTKQALSGESAVTIFDFLGIDTNDLSEEDKLALQNLISKINAQIQVGSKRNKKGRGSLFGDLLGLTDEEVDAVNYSTQLAIDAYNQILDAQEEAINREIELIDRKIAKIQEEIDAQQERVNKEQQLAEEGYANNLTLEQQRLDDLKLREEEQLRIKKETTDKLIRLQKQQAIADYATSSASLIATSAGVISSAVSQMGWVGAIVGLATVASLIAGFASMQQRIKSIEETPSFRDGGVFDVLSGRTSHEKGGVGLYDKGEKIAEFEGDEKLFIVNKGSSKKHASLLEAINNDDLSKIQSLVLDNELIDDNIKGASFVAKKEYEINTSIANIDNESIADLKRTNRQIYELMLNTPIIQDMGDYYIEIVGNVKRTIRKT